MIDINGEPWLIAVDACRLLGLKDLRGGYGHHLKRLDADEVTPMSDVGVKVPGKGMNNCRLVSESGLYKLVGRSSKPEALAFQNWVSREVLPSIRKDGGFWNRFHHCNTTRFAGASLGRLQAEVIASLFALGPPFIDLELSSWGGKGGHLGIQLKLHTPKG